MRVVSLAGPKGSGKNELSTMVAHCLTRRALADAVTADLFDRHLVVREMAFADPLRAMADALGLPYNATRSDKTKPCADLGGATGRDLLVALGEAVRAVCPDYFAAHMKQRLDDLALTDPDALVIVTDTRRENEVDALDAWQRSGSGRLLARLWIERPGADEDEVIEASVRARCVTIQNAGTLADLEVKAAGVADWLAGETGKVAS